MIVIGENFSHYKIISAIGKGGMGEVYLAKDVRLDRKVALKILPPEFAADQDRMNRFAREAKSASALNHPGIITIYEIGAENNTHFIATEFIDGKTLNDFIKTDSLDFNYALEIAIQIASALDEAHSAGIVHRDIKPENVMIRPDGLIKILDFGIAKLSAAAPESDAEAATAIKSGTTPGMIIGTANYMSPEQAAGRAIDARSDIFSFGVVLYEMIAGRLPFEGDTAMEMIGAILRDEPLPLGAPVPNELKKIVGKCLKKDLIERYQTIKEACAELKEFKQELEFQKKLERAAAPNAEEPKTQMMTAQTTDAPRSATSSAEFITGEIKKHKLGAALASLILLALIGGGAWFFLLRSSSAKQIESIAVMPFVNESGNADTEYLSDGMTETLISSLSQLPNLSVKARSSVFRYKGKEINPQTIGKELNVQAILYGRVIQRGEQLTLSLELIDAQVENVIWSEQYNRRQTDLVMLQSEIARDVSQKLKTKLSGADEQKLAKNLTENAEAYKLYLQGRFYWNKRTPQDIQKSIEYFRQATALDPNFALGYAGLADAYAYLSVYGATQPRETMPKAKEAALKALSLDAESAEAHAALGNILTSYDFDFAGAEREYKLAIELNPNYTTARHYYGILLSWLGHHEESIAERKRVLEIDPLSLLANRSYADSLLIARRYDDAIAQLKKTLELDAGYASAYGPLSIAYQMKGDYAESVAALAKYQEMTGDPQGAALMRESYAKGGWQGFLRTVVDKKIRINSPWYSADVFYAALGERDKAFAELNKAYEDRELAAAAIKSDPRLDSLRDDPRFQELLKKVGFP